MRKLKLDLGTLCVESFAADAHPADEGTVHAHATPPTYCGNTCAATCETNCDCTQILSCPHRCTFDTT